jgi:hypothetical protein
MRYRGGGGGEEEGQGEEKGKWIYIGELHPERMTRAGIRTEQINWDG